MEKVVVYTTSFCPYCVSAKKLLDEGNIPYSEINLTGQSKKLEELKKTTNYMTVPQVFINGNMIGGFNELQELENNGELKELLSS